MTPEREIELPIIRVGSQMIAFKRDNNTGRLKEKKDYSVPCYLKIILETLRIHDEILIHCERKRSYIINDALSILEKVGKSKGIIQKIIITEKTVTSLNDKEINVLEYHVKLIDVLT